MQPEPGSQQEGSDQNGASAAGHLWLEPVHAHTCPLYRLLPPCLSAGGRPLQWLAPLLPFQDQGLHGQIHSLLSRSLTTRWVTRRRVNWAWLCLFQRCWIYCKCAILWCRFSQEFMKLLSLCSSRPRLPEFPTIPGCFCVCGSISHLPSDFPKLDNCSASAYRLLLGPPYPVH